MGNKIYSIYRKIYNRTLRAYGGFTGNTIKAFWFAAVINAGDLVTPFLLQKFGLVPIHCSPKGMQAILCGSIMHHVDEQYEGYILGTGFRKQGPSVTLDKAKILAVRGLLTCKRLGVPLDTPLGDPGLLLGRFLTQRQTKRYKIGLIPHYLEKNNPRIIALRKDNYKEIKMIDIQMGPITVCNLIKQCEMIISTSLHGVIFAHSLNIPAVWMELLENSGVRAYKFTDYYSVFNLEPRPFVLEENYSLSEISKYATKPLAEEVEKVNDRLVGAFQQLKSEMIGSYRG